jgi:acyl-CoA reductase-like NAD-dependent aldehyde dehydrogenase
LTHTDPDRELRIVTAEPNAPLPFAEETARCRAAQAAWAERSPRDRCRPLRAVRALLVRDAARLCEAVAQDIHRIPDEVLGSDLLPTADACAWLARHAPRLLAPRRVSRSERPWWLFGNRDTIHRRPWGVVGIIGTWNYPIFLNATQIAHALTAGNGVLWKPSELGATSAALVHALFLEAGYPPDLLQRLPATREAGPLVAEADIDYVVFTGSAGVGRALARRLGERLIPSALELSGCDALIVADDADATLAARAAWFGVTLNHGQTCLAVRRVFVTPTQHEAFLAELHRLSQTASPRPLALPAQAQQLRQLVDDALARGARLLTEPPPALDDHRAIRPVVLVGATADMAVCREAAFSPILAVLAVPDMATALAENARCPYALGASIFTRNPRWAESIAARLGSGVVTINDCIVPTAHPATPFGGRKQSGWGTTQGPDGLLGMTVPQVVSVRGLSFYPHYDTDPAKAAATAQIMHGLLAAGHAASLGQRLAGFWRMLRGMARAR